MNNEKYLEALKLYRMKQNPVAPYKVFSDKIMTKLIEKKPKTLEALSCIEGFPKNGQRILKYGNDIIAIFQINCNVEGMQKF